MDEERVGVFGRGEELREERLNTIDDGKDTLRHGGGCVVQAVEKASESFEHSAASIKSRQTDDGYKQKSPPSQKKLTNTSLLTLSALLATITNYSDALHIINYTTPNSYVLNSA